VPRFTPHDLSNIGIEIFQAAGCSPEDAKVVVDHLVESNLFGHDSHGAIRFHQYARDIREGRYQVDAKPRIDRDRPCVAVVDGCGALGPIAATFATRLAIDKARQQGVATVALHNSSHIGRVGAYPLMAARDGLIGQAFVNAGKLGFEVAPFGGIDGRLSTDPIAFAGPRRDSDPIMLDMTTAVAAVGKIWVAQNRQEKLPPGWIVDANGEPSQDPHAFTGDPPGAILPLGGNVGYKGFGLAVMVELLGGALSGHGCAAGERKLITNGMIINVYCIEHFVDRCRYEDEVEGFVQHVKSSRPASGVGEILFPGEIEFKTARQRQTAGIELDQVTWDQICDEAQKLGIDCTRWDSGV